MTIAVFHSGGTPCLETFSQSVHGATNLRRALTERVW